MTNLVALNNIAHKNLKIITVKSEKFGNKVDCVLTFPSEFSQVQREYPIFFQQHPDTKQFQAVAMLGIAPGENLFLESDGWNAKYIPAIVSSEPFIIGFEDQTATGGSEQEPIVYVNMDSPRVSEFEGEPLFREFGGTTAYLEKVTRHLHAIYRGFTTGQQMFTLFNKMNLIEPVNLEIPLANGEVYRLRGNYTINPEKLAGLDGAALAELNNIGALECAFYVAASINNVKTLIDLKNNRLAL